MTDISIQYPASLAPNLNPADKRQKKWAKQRRNQGFDDTELWNLDSSFARIMLPRVKAYIECAEEIFVLDKRWKNDMASIVVALDLMSQDEKWHDPGTERQIERGVRAFARRIRGMWT